MHWLTKMAYAYGMLLSLALVSNIPSPAVAHPTKRDASETQCSAPGYTGSPSGDMTNCACLLEGSSDPESFNGDDSQILTLDMPYFFENLTTHSCEHLYGYAWGSGILASDVSVLYQDAGCNASDSMGPGGRVDPENVSKCASGLVRVQYNRTLEEDRCTVPDGGFKFSKDECMDWVGRAKGTWSVS